MDAYDTSGNVVAHLVGGIILTILAVWMLPRALWMTLAVCALLGLYIAAAGNTFNHKWVLIAHIVVCGVFVAAALRWIPA